MIGLSRFVPGFSCSDMSDGMIVDLIASYLVLPNRFTLPLSSQVNAAQLRFPVPQVSVGGSAGGDRVTGGSSAI